MEKLNYHNPVLLQESIEGLNIKPDGVYVDVTFGGGGHSTEILKRLGENGRLYAFDQDADAAENIIDDSRFRLLPHNFRFLKRFLRLEGVRKIDGLLADLGVSSHQFDTADRGFSFRFDARLDMRMNQGAELTAEKVINSYNAQQLQHIFGMYGEVRNAKTLAQLIVKTRESGVVLKTIGDFVAAIDKCIKGKKNRYLSQVFQALRMEVNEEIEVLKEMLWQSTEVLHTGGRLVVISYHSLEDRLAKNLIKKGTFEKEPEKDDYGNFYQPLKAINKKIILPTEQEIKENPRARSAKMRIAERTDKKPLLFI
ncbi:16S rRNA (cytosine(1402)-N(4))-methyltransferase RsmH [Aureispira anguillae]|uniref:Ribosomal RNA small subunit methyltransferase H n=1 Tax=Aureispira anguillae TaxID=2864201 RepID=A0A915YH07_9BACT|nr:16S rRNA (cytosine(1402)-N(4))-methyltransferase RsmH [Aureispira anguillae]BDS12859.1 16S rRNA (cytosine(1402)-N(4))-methyltransferaseRsmH [Aureispira anguillae]